MALDEPRETDNVYTKDELTFVMETGLLEDAKPVTIDFIETEWGSGYNISSSLSGAAGCGSCRC
ncbi:MAG: hypothetical protein M0Q23_09590 [Syntrophales bacterium]|jgi:Fe-S cluster assembly iron-binding protein IscA|nr:hypothetical protein [Syntrophales bacterium]MCK9528866.1 hypothetical protein [Syntrophales bacterium]MDX9921160.1 hypothetical protein [Syntrophales bacterium]